MLELSGFGGFSIETYASQEREESQIANVTSTCAKWNSFGGNTSAGIAAIK